MAQDTGKGRNELARWNPFADLDLFEDWPVFRHLGPRMQRLEEARVPVPAMDVHESEKEYVVSAEIPGIAKQDVTVECHEGMLTIRGEKRSEREDKDDEKRRWTERVFGSFSRSFRLPRDADPDAIQASFKDGVLTVTIGRSGENKPRVVSIES